MVGGACSSLCTPKKHGVTSTQLVANAFTTDLDRSASHLGWSLWCAGRRRSSESGAPVASRRPRRPRRSKEAEAIATRVHASPGWGVGWMSNGPAPLQKPDALGGKSSSRLAQADVRTTGDAMCRRTCRCRSERRALFRSVRGPDLNDVTLRVNGHWPLRPILHCS